MEIADQALPPGVVDAVRPEGGVGLDEILADPAARFIHKFGSIREGGKNLLFVALKHSFQGMAEITPVSQGSAGSQQKSLCARGDESGLKLSRVMAKRSARYSSSRAALFHRSLCQSGSR